MFAGGGRLYEACWSRAGGGATIDKDEVKAREAAILRPHWAVGQGDAIRVIEAGWLRAVPFAVVDIDAWGAPWDALRAWCASDRRRAQITNIFLTDGYRRRCNFASRCAALWGDEPKRVVTSGEYDERVRLRLPEWGALAKVELAILHELQDKGMWLYHLAARRLA
jgi:hypothetical protein